MDFTDRIRKLADRLHERRPHIHTEEATKQSLVIPFIRDLGYDIYNPAEVVPEYTADLDTRKGEKVDYAILKDGSPIILIECKDVDVTLGREQRAQLTRYFMVTKEVRYAILTNGIIYQFFTELDEKNRMDIKPFLTIDMESLDDRHVRELERFTKDVFDADKIFSSARELRFMREIGERITAEFREPSEQLVRHFAKQVYSGPLTKPRMEEFTRFVREALRNHVNDQVRARLQSAMIPAVEEDEPDAAVQEDEQPSGTQPDGPPDFSVHPNWNKADEELREFFMDLHDYVFALGEDVSVKPTKSYISFKRNRNVVDVILQPRKRRLMAWVILNPDSVPLQEGFTRNVTGVGHYSPNNLETTISNHDDLERAKPLIQRSYEEAG